MQHNDVMIQDAVPLQARMFWFQVLKRNLHMCTNVQGQFAWSM